MPHAAHGGCHTRTSTCDTHFTQCTITVLWPLATIIQEQRSIQWICKHPKAEHYQTSRQPWVADTPYTAGTTAVLAALVSQHGQQWPNSTYARGNCCSPITKFALLSCSRMCLPLRQAAAQSLLRRCSTTLAGWAQKKGCTPMPGQSPAILTYSAFNPSPRGGLWPQVQHQPAPPHPTQQHIHPVLPMWNTCLLLPQVTLLRVALLAAVAAVGWCCGAQQPWPANTPEGPGHEAWPGCCKAPAHVLTTCPAGQSTAMQCWCV